MVEFRHLIMGIFSIIFSNSEITLIINRGGFVLVILSRRAIGKAVKNQAKYFSVLKPAKLNAAFRYQKAKGFSPLVCASVGKNLLPKAENGLSTFGSINRQIVREADTLKLT